METSKERICRYLQDAHAAEMGIVSALDGFVNDTDDTNIRSVFQEHALQSKDQANRIENRLRELGEEPSSGKSFLNNIMAKASEIMQGAHDEYDKNTQNLVKAYATEHLERGMYESLYAFATAVGDTQTARLAREIQQEEESMGQKLFPMIQQYAQTAVAATKDIQNPNAYPL
jgi:ferritin-like metal-binding protein YciE